MESFINDVIQGNQKVARKQTAASESIADKGTSWIMFKEAADKMGADVVEAMVKASTLPSRRHARCPPSLGIPYPHYLEVCVDVETSTKRARATDEHTKDQDVDEAMWENAMSHTETDEAPPKPAKQARARPCGNDDTDDMISERDKQAVRDLLLSVRKTHGSYDRASREGKQVFQRAPRTRTRKTARSSAISRCCWRQPRAWMQPSSSSR